MNLIVNRPLGQAEKQLIYELTLKKRKSKKSTMSEKQFLARQQLARELLPHQRMGPMDSLDSLNSSSSTTLFSSPIIMNSMASGDDDDHQRIYSGESIRDALASRNLAKLGSTQSDSSSVISSESSNKVTGGGGGGGSCLSSSSAISTGSCGGGGHCEGVDIMSSSLGGASGGSSTASSSSSSSGCSFSRSDSSYSGSSQDSSNCAAASTAADELSRRTELELEARKKEANIRFKRSKLDYLNEELGKRLYQYEYLVAQEKALLGTYNMMLFTNEGVNNFHLMRNVPFRPD